MRSWAERFVPIFDLTHVATYYAATGNRDAALGAIERASTSLTEFSAMRTPEGNATFMSIGRVLLAVAHATLLRSRAANDLLSHLEQSDPNAIAAVKCLALAARTFNRVAQGVAERDALDRDLAKVRERGLGGYADLLAAFPVGVARSAAAFGTLTKAELQMLRLIARGGTMKAIAAELSRSPDTVETHIRAVLRKLGCKTRNEAVALARDHGII
jgi:DNA-binding CsgD family transcriptional regulator